MPRMYTCGGADVNDWADVILSEGKNLGVGEADLKACSYRIAARSGEEAGGARAYVRRTMRRSSVISSMAKRGPSRPKPESLTPP